MTNIEELVPCRSLCRKLSKKDFKDPAFVWLKVPGDSFRDSFWVLETRERLESLQIKLEFEEWLPAPPVEEFLQKFTLLKEGLVLRTRKNRRWDVEQMSPLQVGSVFAGGKTLADVFCRLYLQLKKSKGLIQ